MIRAATLDDEQAAWTVLQRAAYPALRALSCRATAQSIVLMGHVPSFYQKQLAQSLLLGQFGEALQVENRLTVVGQRVESIPVTGI